MSSGFYKIQKGVTYTPQFQYGTGDPSDGTNGDIYYNGVLQVFRRFQNGSWGNFGGGGSSSAAIWVADDVPVTSGSTNVVIDFANDQPDLSYMVFAQFENLTDPFPQFQQVEITNKSISGFTATWNIPTDSGNYSLLYIVPPKVFPAAEVPIGSAATSINPNFMLAQGSSGYVLLNAMQNLVDPSPQFQTAIVTARTTSGFTATWNAPTDSVNYTDVYSLSAVGQVVITNGATSATGPLPIDFGTTVYTVLAMMYDTTDPFPQFQPIVITAKNTNNFTASWNAFADSANYVMVYYALSISP
jgi:hypothetical protein